MSLIIYGIIAMILIYVLLKNKGKLKELMRNKDTTRISRNEVEEERKEQIEFYNRRIEEIQDNIESSTRKLREELKKCNIQLEILEGTRK